MRRNKAAVLLALMVFLSLQLTGCQMIMQLLQGLMGGGAAMPAAAAAQGANLLNQGNQPQALAYMGGSDAAAFQADGLRQARVGQKVDSSMLNKGNEAGSTYVKGDAF